MKPIYLDHAATTGVHPEVLEAMLPYLGPQYGNPGSGHVLGCAAKQAVDEARAKIARVLGCKPGEVIFTGCATESINLALKGILHAAGKTGHLVTTTIEHPAVLHTAEHLEKEGYEVTRVPVSSEGVVDPEEIRRALRPDTRLIAVMYVNNEIGTIQPLAEISKIARERDIPFFSDCVASACACRLDVGALGVDALALSGHKFYAPKGVGLLYLREGIRLEAQLDGGGQEGDRRSGTENVPYLVGISAALERIDARREETNARLAKLRDDFLGRLLAALPDRVRLNGSRTERIASNLNLSFRVRDPGAIIAALVEQGVCASSGPACHGNALKASHVLRALRTPEEWLYSSLRLTLGEHTTADELETVLGILVPLVKRLPA